MLGLSQEPQEPVPRRGLESLRVRSMESPELGELLESLPEAVLFPHLHHQNPQGPQELAHRRVVKPPRVQEQVKWGVMQEPAQPVFLGQVPQLSPAEPLGRLAQGRPPAVRVVLAVLEVVPRS